MSDLARLLVPVLRWNPDDGFDAARRTAEEALELGVGGFILFGGPAEEIHRLISEVSSAATRPLFFGSDLERGAGQQFPGATPLPPAAALGSLDDATISRRAGELTAREARAIGVNWVFAPVADVDIEPRNPIIGTRAFGTSPEIVAAHASAWTEGCRKGGALSCGKHFPGHGRTTADSHAEKPTVDADFESLRVDLHPFRELIDAGVDTLMTAHVAYPALDPSGAVATLSRPILHDLLRREMGFEGLVVTDALIMEGVIEGGTEGEAAVRALSAGCDMLLYPEDLRGVLESLRSARGTGALERGRVSAALERAEAALDRVAGEAAEAGAWGREEDRRWALETGRRTLQVVRGEPAVPEGPVRLVEIDDDTGGPYPPYARDALGRALADGGVRLDPEGAPLVVVYADIRAWKGRPGLSSEARDGVGRILADHPDATVLLFSHPRLAAELPRARHLLAAWGGESLMQEAVASWLTGREDAVATSGGGLDR